MDNNNMYQNQQSGGTDPNYNQNGFGTEPNNQQFSGTEPNNQQYGGTDSNYQQYGGTDSNYQQYGGTDSNYQQYGGADSNYQQYGGQDNSYSQYGATNTGYQYNNNGGYQIPYTAPPQTDLEEPVKVGEWLIAMLLMMVPCVNIIMMFVWAFSNSEKKSKSNYFKATLIMFGIVFLLYIIMIIAAVAIGAGLSSHLY